MDTSPFIPLAERIEALPLVLAGPIVRRVEPHAVTVWVALRAPALVTLTVQNRAGQALLSGQRATVTIGAHLHFVAVTAAARVDGDSGDDPPGPPLSRGDIYDYDLGFELAHTGAGLAGETGAGLAVDARAGLFSPHVLAADPDEARSLLLYQPDIHPLPSFVVPPADVESVRLVHGSCRWLHRGGEDALPILDRLIRAGIDEPARRPQLFLLTGDGIYADGSDVPPLWGSLVLDVGAALIGWREFLPGVDRRIDEIDLDERQAVHGQFTGHPEPLRFQLFGLGEYLAMHLLALSNAPWPDRLTSTPGDPLPGKLMRICDGLRQVRRALAHISTYSIFDDHEIGDDWNMTLDWCQRVYARPLGRRMVQNGLSAFALIHGWGNQPEIHARPPSSTTPGARLLDALSEWRPTDASAEASPRAAELLTLLGIPASADELHHKSGPARLQPGPQAVPWHFAIAAPGYDILAMDTRTHRAFPGESPLGQTDHVWAAAMAKQLPSARDRTTLVISPTPVIAMYRNRTVKLAYHVGTWLKGLLRYPRTGIAPARYRAYAYDLGDKWRIDSPVYSALFARLAPRRRVVFLSGDIHLSCASRMRYHGAERALFVQLISSGLLNEKPSKLARHRGGYSYPWPESDRPPRTRGRMNEAGDGLGARYEIDHQRSARRYPEGRDIVGRNNLCEVVFTRGATGLVVRQRVHWRERQHLPAGPHTVFTVELE